MVKVIENLLGRFVNRCIDYFFFKKFSGYFLHQLDTKGTMRADAVYLLSYLFTDGPEPVEISRGAPGAVPPINCPTEDRFIDNGDGTGTLDFMPDFFQAGVYNVTFYATDGVGGSDSQVVAITVDNTNRPPVLDPIGSRQVDEGANLNFIVTGSDPDLTTPGLSAANVPANATFTDNGDGTGVFDFTPSVLQAGVYNVTFIASDGSADAELRGQFIFVQQTARWIGKQ